MSVGSYGRNMSESYLGVDGFKVKFLTNGQLTLAILEGGRKPSSDGCNEANVNEKDL